MLRSPVNLGSKFELQTKGNGVVIKFGLVSIQRKFIVIFVKDIWKRILLISDFSLATPIRPLKKKNTNMKNETFQYNFVTFTEKLR